jgi:DNA end-binding protein Ku
LASPSVFERILCMAIRVIPPTTRACEPHAAPASRATWCGQLRVGDLCVPVKAYAAIATPPENPLRQLHAGCGRRIEYRKWCPKHGAVPPEKIVKGYPYQADQYVVLSEAELAEIQPAHEKTIHLEHFLDPELVDLVLLAGRSLSLAPANAAAQRPFAMVCRALEHSRKWALGRVVFSNRWQILLVRPENQTLLAHTLHHPAQRRALAGADASNVEVSQRELRPVLRRINSADERIPWDEYQDDSERHLTALVEAKLAPARKPRAASSKRRRASGSKAPAKPRTSRTATTARRKAA